MLLSNLLAYGFPAAVTLYGVGVLIAGNLRGWGTRTVQGTAARVLGIYLTVALPFSIWFGPLLGSRPITRGVPLMAQGREADIMGEISDELRQLREWQEQNAPDLNRTRAKENSHALAEVQEHNQALNNYNREAFTRMQESYQRVQSLRDEQSNLREKRLGLIRQQQTAPKRGGPLWVGVGVLLSARALAGLLGRSRGSHSGQQEPTGPGEVQLPALMNHHETAEGYQRDVRSND